MKSSLSSDSVKFLRVFSKNHSVPEKRRTRSKEKEEAKCLSELSKYLKELSHLSQKVQRRSILLQSGASQIEYISSSKDPKMLRKILKLKLTLLTERKDRLLQEISDVFRYLSSQKVLLEGSSSSGSSIYDVSSLLEGSSSALALGSSSSALGRTLSTSNSSNSSSNSSQSSHPSSNSSSSSSSSHSSSSSSSPLSLSSLLHLQSSLNHKVLLHYSRYNSTLSEIEILIEDSSISKADRKIIYSVLFPSYSNDSLSILTKGLRSIFGSRVCSASNFCKEMIRKSSSSEIYLSNMSDRFEIFSCYLYFLRHNSLLSSSYIFGVASTLCYSLYSTTQLPLPTVLSILLVSGLGIVLFGWSSFAVINVFFRWTLGQSIISDGDSLSSSSSGSSLSDSSLSSSGSSSKLSSSSGSSNSSSKLSSSSNKSSSSSSSSSRLSSSNKLSSSLSSSLSSILSSSSSSSSNRNSLFSSTSKPSSSSSSLSSSKPSSSSSSNILSSSLSSSSSSLFSSSLSSSGSRSISISKPSSSLSSSSLSSSSLSSSSKPSSSSIHMMYDEIYSGDSDLTKMFPLFAANLITSVGLCVASVSSIDYLLSKYIPRYSMSIFLLVCLSASLLSIGITMRRSLLVSKSSSNQSFSYGVSLCALMVSACLGVSIASAWACTVLKIFGLHK
ncbi:hypothetical protein NERG_00529 [Nematocida ausubeli]|uniref:Transmembrane protein n=1 Tax=Nematocida ausubeli (strain ATCC PRA-371 / ERTm2) TaxID=1913371 RepID=H8ZAA8_NEMA1|nr:hypothetical protein NERG_00529 [Nematocida ausubeli]